MSYKNWLKKISQPKDYEVNITATSEEIRGIKRGIVIKNQCPNRKQRRTNDFEAYKFYAYNE